MNKIIKIVFNALVTFLPSSLFAQDVVMGEYSTKYVFRTPDTRDRAHNIALAASKINGYIIQPGDTFSYNSTIGKRTEARGFREAHAIVNKVMVDELGGGICQVSGTLHAAAYYAGMEIVEYRPHSRASTYISPGLDATVNWGSIDLKMRNPFPFPVTIKSEISETPTSWGGSVKVLTVRIFGKKKYPVDVEIITLKKKPFYRVTIKRPDLKKGYRFVYQPGTKEYLIRRTRTRTISDGSKVTDSIDIYYEKSTRITIIGTGEKKP